MNKTKIAVFMLLFGATGCIYAQTTQASLTGKIASGQKSSAPVRVEMVNESTGFHSVTETNSQGEYVFKEIPLGGPYTIIINGQKKTGYYVNFGDVVKVDFLDEAEKAREIDAVTIKGNLKSKVANLGASTAITAKNIEVLPVNGRNFTNLTELSPLSGKGGNLSGQLNSSTNFTIDGMNAKNPTSAGSTTSRSGAPYTISIEAVREFKIITNQYDVTLGRSGGGMISAVTKSGTNTTTGSVFEYMRTGWLSSKYDIRGNIRKNDFSTYQFGLTLGGPIIKNKLHYFFAWDHQLDSRPLIIADIQSNEDALRFNVTSATLNNIQNIARSKYGLGNTAQFGSFDYTRNSDAGLLRLDWQINDKNLLTIRNNFTYDFNKNGLVDNTAINFLESYANDKNWDNSLLMTLRSIVSPRITNELKFQHLYTYQNSYQSDQLGHMVPRAIVERVPSVVNGTTLNTNIQFGGHRFAQENFKNNVFQLVDNLYFNTDKVKYTAGIDLMYTNGKSVYGSEVNGRFHFLGVDNFNNQKAYRYYREVPLMDDTQVTSNILNMGLYGQAQAKLGQGLTGMAGIRMDYATYPKAQFNQKLFDEMGIRTDNRIKSFIIQPRFQLDWNIGENNTDYLRLGAGIFSSDINNYMLINNLSFDGNHYATVDVDPSKIGLTPNFIDYRNNPGTIPTLAQYQVPTINYTGKYAKLPKVYKANISYNHYFTERFRVGVSGYMALGRNNYFYYDRNMVVNPYFTLSNENNRGVFVPLSAVNANGTLNWTDGRINNKFGRVLELVSDGKVNQFSIVGDLSYRYYRDGEIFASYTWADIKDNTSYNGNVANTATLSTFIESDPRILKMTYSDNQFRNKVVVYGNTPSWKGFQLGVRYTGIGGTRFNVTAGGNINGDFVATNDLAFIFPNLVQPLIDSPDADGVLKKYLTDNAGRIAERNSGINNFFGTVDLRLSKKFALVQKTGLEFSVDIFNFANMLNKEWGVNKSFGTTGLYRITGFDPVTKNFNYALNTKGLAPLSGNPWQIQIGTKFTF